MTATFLTMVPPMYLPKELGKNHVLRKGSVLHNVQVMLNCDAAKGSLNHDLSVSLERTTAGSSRRWLY